MKSKKQALKGLMQSLEAGNTWCFTTASCRKCAYLVQDNTRVTCGLFAAYWHSRRTHPSFIRDGSHTRAILKMFVKHLLDKELGRD